MTPFKKIRHRIEYAGCRALAWVIPRLSRRTVVRLANGLGALACRLDRRGRAVAESNLELALGDRLTEAGRRETIRASYQGFARTMLDLFWSPRLDRDNWRQYIHVTGAEPAQEALRSGSGLVFLCSHCAGFEWANLWAGFDEVAPMSVAENFKNRLLDPVFQELRQLSGATMIPQEKSILRMLKAVKRGGAAALLIDLTVPPSQASAAVEGFGMKMSVSVLHAVIAQRTGAPLFPAVSEPQPDGTMRLEIGAPLRFGPEATLSGIAQGCWDAFEPVIRQKPHLWIWFYKHWRYKPRAAARPYPFYANVSPKFERLLKRQEHHLTNRPR